MSFPVYTNLDWKLLNPITIWSSLNAAETIGVETPAEIKPPKPD